jgi:polyhydroxyalkanoate synthesis repressor PhaR
MTVLIKRYANRKLYNTQTSRYITLKGIAELIEAGEDVRVVDNETGEDITSVALSQILVDNERESRSVPKTLLSDLIQRGGDVLYGALRRGVGDASEGLEELQRNVRRFIRAREEDGQRLSEWIAYATPDFDRVIQGALERVFKLLDLPRRGDIEALNRNLQRVADAVERLESARRAPAPPASAQAARAASAAAGSPAGPSPAAPTPGPKAAPPAGASPGPAPGPTRATPTPAPKAAPPAEASPAMPTAGPKAAPPAGSSSTPAREPRPAAAPTPGGDSA